MRTSEQPEDSRNIALIILVALIGWIPALIMLTIPKDER